MQLYVRRAALLAALALAAFAPATVGAASNPYSISLQALTGPQGGILAISVANDPGIAAIETLAHVTVDERSFKDVPVRNGVATLELGPVERGTELRVQAQIKPDTRTFVLRDTATVKLRPDLVVTTVRAPAQTLTTRPIDVRADIAEVNGDTGGTATATLLWGPSVLGTTSVTVPAGGHASVSFTGVKLTTAQPVDLSVLVSDASPGETNAENNDRAATVDVTESELASSRLVLDSLGGYGVQMNGHVYAGVLPAPPASMPDLEAKVKALEPQLVRVFYSEQQETSFPERLESFADTVQLAQEAGATINITYQSTARAKLNPVKFMNDFAAVLDNLVRVRGLANVRWVTIQNEPNSTAVTLQQYEALYRALDTRLRALGLRDQIRFMGGDLVEDGGSNGTIPDHHAWWDYMAQHMNDLLDAYSVHIYWNYWDIPRMEFRLKDVRQIVDALPAGARKPVYVTEFGVRGILKLADGTTVPQPGTWQDGTPLAQTNIAAFQQLWFTIAATQLGYAGVVKWDAYWGKYDGSYRAAHYLIGPPEEGWPLYPAYHAFRMLLQTTERGWRVLGVDPWTDDDWKLSPEGAADDQPEKELVACKGPAGELTIVGLDSHGRDLNAASAEAPAYSVGGLTPFTTFHLAVWNAGGDGQNSLAATVTANEAGVVRFTVPLQAAFALTTVPVG